MLGKRYILIMLLGLTLADMPVTGQVSLSGFIKNFSVLYEYPGKNLLTFWNLPDHHEYGSVNQRFRLTATDRLSPSLAVETACELSIRLYFIPSCFPLPVIPRSTG
jgi:hypothetical protein